MLSLGTVPAGSPRPAWHATLRLPTLSASTRGTYAWVAEKVDREAAEWIVSVSRVTALRAERPKTPESVSE